jgi:hypothetical protein
LRLEGIRSASGFGLRASDLDLDLMAGVKCSGFVLLAFWVIGANVQAERFVALQLEGAHHFIERRACGRTRGFEQPSTFGATKAPKTRLLNPYQFLVHGRLCRCSLTSRDRVA